MELGCCVKHLLDTCNVRGEGRNDHSARCAANDPLERLANDLLTWRVPGSFSARAIRHQCKHPLCTEPCQHGEVCRLSIGWSLVKFEVAGVDHRANR